MKVAGILSAFAQLLIACAIGGIAFVGTLYLPSVEKYVNDKARQDCAMAYRSEYFDQKTNTTVSSPIEDLYKQCLKDKNLN